MKNRIVLFVLLICAISGFSQCYDLTSSNFGLQENSFSIEYNYDSGAEWNDTIRIQEKIVIDSLTYFVERDLGFNNKKLIWVDSGDSIVYRGNYRGNQNRFEDVRLEAFISESIGSYILYLSDSIVVTDKGLSYTNALGCEFSDLYELTFHWRRDGGQAYEKRLVNKLYGIVFREFLIETESIWGELLSIGSGEPRLITSVNNDLINAQTIAIYRVDKSIRASVTVEGQCLIYDFSGKLIADHRLRIGENYINIPSSSNNLLVRVLLDNGDHKTIKI